jgi:hypothetical protein
LIEQVLHGGDLDFEDILQSPSTYQNFMTRLTENSVRSVEETASILNCSVGNDKNFFKFAAWPSGDIGKGLPKTQSIVLDNMPEDCWGRIQVDFTLTGSHSYEVQITPALLRDPTF